MSWKTNRFQSIAMESSGAIDCTWKIIAADFWLFLNAGKPETLLFSVKDRPGHGLRYALNRGKIHRELGWQAAISLEDGLRQTIDWYKHNSEWLSGVRDGAYRSYYEKYYKQRDSSLHAIGQSGPKASK